MVQRFLYKNTVVNACVHKNTVHAVVLMSLAAFVANITRAEVDGTPSQIPAF